MKNGLYVHIYSFSYHGSGIPQDPEGHGGGFVFDCRWLRNPGREDAYKELSGRDRLVVEYLEKRKDVRDFWLHLSAIVDDAVEVYRERGYSDLSVGFGCTGGRHRSVYLAERLRRHLSENDVACGLVHRDLPEESS